jgi:hypothetical protein
MKIEVGSLASPGCSKSSAADTTFIPIRIVNSPVEVMTARRR